MSKDKSIHNQTINMDIFNFLPELPTAKYVKVFNNLVEIRMHNRRIAIVPTKFILQDETLIDGYYLFSRFMEDGNKLPPTPIGEEGKPGISCRQIRGRMWETKIPLTSEIAEAWAWGINFYALKDQMREGITFTHPGTINQE